jgi:hypothetical protein
LARVLCPSTGSHSDLKSVVEARGDLSTGLGGAYQTLSTDHFSLICSPNPAESEEIAHLLELAYHHFGSLFSGYHFELRTPPEKLRWVIFASGDSFSRYAIETEGWDLSWLTGYYSAKTNTVAIVTPQKTSEWQVRAQSSQAHDIIACPPDAETALVQLVHEAAHQLSFNTGLQKRKVLYPIWASEGLAMFFERSLLSKYSESKCCSGARGRRLAQLHRQGQLIRLEEFISISRLDETARAIDVYAQAWGLFQFLCEHQRDSLRKYFSNLYDLEPGWRDERTLACEFVEAFGSPDQLDGQWQRFLEELSSGQ